MKSTYKFYFFAILWMRWSYYNFLVFVMFFVLFFTVTNQSHTKNTNIEIYMVT